MLAAQDWRLAEYLKNTFCNPILLHVLTLSTLMLSHLVSIFIRQNTDQRGNDLIDLMIDAMEDKLSHEVDQDGGQFEKDARLTHRNKKREFDMTTLAATALVLLFAGYDTTGITLGSELLALKHESRILGQ